MARKLPLIAVVASLVGLVAAANAAAAVGLHSQRATASPERPVVPASRLIAPTDACPNQGDLEASTEVQEEAMRCMTDFARQRAGLGELSDTQELALSARAKLDDILRCDSFSHFACGREFTYWMQETGYIAATCWRAGENLAWGTGESGTVRAIFKAWMRSPSHRQNILGNYSQIGVSVTTGTLTGRDGVHVWAQHFGSHCDASPAEG